MSEDQDQDQPRIHIDSDWKKQAQAEKQRLSEQSRQRQQPPRQDSSGAGPQPARGGAEAPSHEMPPATFETLMSTMATQALFALGAIADPRTGQRSPNLDLARHHIDLLGVIEEKTHGNLTEEERQSLAATLYELRTRYVQMAADSRPAAEARAQQGARGGG